MTTIQPETLVADRYWLIGRIRSRESGEVWEARDELAPGRSVELEFLASPPVGANAIRRFEDVMNSLRWPFFSHPNVVRVLGHGRWSGKAFVVTERVVGETLAERLQRDGPLERSDSSRLASEVRDAMEAAHQVGVGHGYLSSETVIIGPQGQALVAGLGLAPGNWRQPPRTQESSSAEIPSGQPAQVRPAPLTLRPRVKKADLERIEALQRQLMVTAAPAPAPTSSPPRPARTTRGPVTAHGTLVGRREQQREPARTEPHGVVPPSGTAGERAVDGRRMDRVPGRPVKKRRRILVLRAVGALVVVGILISAVAISIARVNESAPPDTRPPGSPTTSAQPSSAPDTTASPGVGFIPVPNVVGLTALQAYAELIHAHLEMARLVPVLEGSPGQVVRTDPPVGASVRPGTPVTLYVATTPDRLSPSPSG